MADTQDYLERINQCKLRMAEIFTRADTLPKGERALLDEAYETLNNTLEELEVTQEELREQNDELVEAQAALSIEKARYQDLFHLAPDGFLVTDLRGEISEANQAAGDLLNIHPKNLVGRKFADFLWVEEKQKFPHYLKQIQEGTQIRNWIVRIRPRNQGTGYYVEVNASLILTNSNHPTNLHWLLRDVNARLQAEEALKKSEARFRTIFEQAALGIELIDLDGRIVEINPTLESMLGYSAQELNRHHFADITDRADVKGSIRQFQDLVDKKTPSYRLEKRFIQKNGKKIWVRLTLALYTIDGVPQYVIGMVEDISYQKQMEIELAEVQRRLLDSIEQERLHLARELHDGPIQDLYGASFQLSGIEEDRTPPEILADIQSSHQMIQKVVRALRTIIGELRPPTLAPFGLEKAIRSHAETLQENSPEIYFDLDLQPDQQAIPEHLRLTLFRIYQQIISNVLRHAEATEVLIRFQMTGHELSLTVRDNGKGFQMPKRKVDLVRRGHFGLVGAEERAEAVGGRLIVESTPGSGTNIHVVIPYEIDPPEPAQ